MSSSWFQDDIIVLITVLWTVVLITALLQFCNDNKKRWTTVFAQNNDRLQYINGKIWKFHNSTLAKISLSLS